MIRVVVVMLLVALTGCARLDTQPRPQQASGIKICEVDQTSAIVWTRLTRFAERVNKPAPLPTVTYRNSAGEVIEPRGRQRDAIPTVEYPEGASGPIPISLRWVHPMIEIPRLAIRGTESPSGTASPTARRGASQVEGRSLWSFDHPEELVPGRYEFQIRLRDNSRVLASHAFEVVDC